MGKALYRKYRSRSLSEVVGQEHITTTLGNALKQGKIAHAYLLTGPRGVGKTSIARILAHEINSLPYSEEPHFDIIEIDAASNNGVEDVRDLRDKIMSAPASAKYKVFIIDEVHMLSKAAFNALLETLEEPPEHVVFILATTEAHKLPETIISRTQRFSFRPAQRQAVVSLLRHIAKQEHIAVDDATLELIAEHGEGSFRDSVSLLDQASSIAGDVTSDAVEQLLGRAPSDNIQALADGIAAHDSAACLTVLAALRDQGYEPAMIALQLGARLRAELVSGTNETSHLELLRELLDVPPAHNPQALLELIIMKYSLTFTRPGRNSTELEKASQVKQPAEPATKDKLGKHGNRSTETPSQETPAEPQPAHSTKPAAAPEETVGPDETAQAAPPVTTEAAAEASSSAPPPESAEPGTDDIAALWHAVLQQLKQTHNTLYGIARMARPKLEDDTLTLELNFAFHQKRLNEPKNRSVLANIVESVRGVPTQIHCVTNSVPKPAPTTSEAFATISNIFGGAELLES